MLNYTIKRVIQAIPMLLVVSIISFGLLQMAPGDPATAYITPKMNAAQVQMIRENLGLDQPVHIQYIKWLSQVLKGDFGYSMVDHRAVSDVIMEKIPATVLLMGSAVVISLVVAIPIGMYTALKRNKIIDKLMMIVAYIGISIPSFWFGIILIYVFSYKLNLFPSVGMRTTGTEGELLDILHHLVLPCAVLSFYNIAVYTRFIRSSTITELSQNYIMVEEAFGFKKSYIVLVYVLKNIMLPIITILGMSLPSIVSGAFITETVFSWPGMGRLGISAIMNYDYPVIMAITMITSILLILGNMLADILYAVVDPRITLER